VISSGLDSAIIQRGDGDLIVEKPNSIFTLPDYYSNQTEIAHFMYESMVFDPGSGFGIINGIEIVLPDDSIDVFPYGLTSSIVQTIKNEFYEYTGYNWNLVANHSGELVIFDYSLIDIGLYVGSVAVDGLSLIASGIDDDNDLLPNALEDYYRTFDNNPDSDDDGISDMIEVAFSTNPLINDRNNDADQDGLSNIIEYEIQSDPGNPDTDYGGSFDGWEWKYQLNVTDPSDDIIDNDADGLVNYVESEYNTNPYSIDTDGDGMDDKWEITFGLDPLDPRDAEYDYDNDGISNLQEYLDGTDPLKKDGQLFIKGFKLWFFVIVLLAIIPVHTTYKKLLNDEFD
ncbi:MAG: hypothetical protein OEZ01_09055, partial [Candidatus Heimdallarchaeota archaeon]|nr:hypothetical protein [Candidatus Heimdallarchaeota archaeon]